MGACILCGKSAGLFYSLHKSCFEKYNASNEAIEIILNSGLGQLEANELAQNVRAFIGEHEFSSEASQRMLNRALEHFSKIHIEKKLTDNLVINAWLDLLKILSPDENLFLNEHFIVQQENFPALLTLKQGKLPDSNCHPANFSIELNQDEQLWWCFDESHVEQLCTVNKSRQWTILMQIIGNVLPGKKQKNKFESQILAKGRILLTNQRMCFDEKEGVSTVSYNNIYSCTPIAGGARVQLKDSGAVPQTYMCEDGRLLYLFLRYASENTQK